MEKRKRNSSLEFLRILSIILVIFCHYSCHGGIRDSLEPSDFSVNVGYLYSIGMFGRSACSVFSMITGYFMINAVYNKDFYKRIIPIVFRASFYSLLAFLIVLIFQGEWVIKDLLKSLFPLLLGDNWYIATYVLFFFFIPFFNKMVNSLDKKQFKVLLITFFIPYFILNSLPIFNFLKHDFIFMSITYLIGAYYRKYGKEEQKHKNNVNLMLSLVFAFLLIGTVWVIGYLGYRFDSNRIYQHVIFYETEYNILNIGFSFFLFAYFANKQFYNPIINLISSTTMGIYLIHDNTLLWQFVWGKWSANVDHLNDIYIHSIVKVACIFVICALIDLIRQLTIGKLFDLYIYPKIYVFAEKISESKVVQKLLSADK